MRCQRGRCLVVPPFYRCVKEGASGERHSDRLRPEFHRKILATSDSFQVLSVPCPHSNNVALLDERGNLNHGSSFECGGFW